MSQEVAPASPPRQSLATPVPTPTSSPARTHRRWAPGSHPKAAASARGSCDRPIPRVIFAVDGTGRRPPVAYPQDRQGASANMPSGNAQRERRRSHVAANCPTRPPCPAKFAQQAQAKGPPHQAHTADRVRNNFTKQLAATQYRDHSLWLRLCALWPWLVCLFVCQRDPPPRPQQRSLTLPRFGILRAYATYWNLRSLWAGSCDVPPGIATGGL